MVLTSGSLTRAKEKVTKINDKLIIINSQMVLTSRSLTRAKKKVTKINDKFIIVLQVQEVGPLRLVICSFRNSPHDFHW